MKQKQKTKRREEELLRLYQNKKKEGGQFKIKTPKARQKKTISNQIKPLSLRSLGISLLLTFAIISVQLLVSQFI
jgi:hypothetical protein